MSWITPWEPQWSVGSVHFCTRTGRVLSGVALAGGGFTSGDLPCVVGILATGFVYYVIPDVGVVAAGLEISLYHSSDFPLARFLSVLYV